MEPELDRYPNAKPAQLPERAAFLIVNYGRSGLSQG